MAGLGSCGFMSWSASIGGWFSDHNFERRWWLKPVNHGHSRFFIHTEDLMLPLVAWVYMAFQRSNGAQERRKLHDNLSPYGKNGNVAHNGIIKYPTKLDEIER